MPRIKIFTDGASRGNPGPAAAGALFYDERGELIDGFSKKLGTMTNNQAEYEAVILALANVLSKYPKDEIIIHLDSQLACEQLNRNYKVKNQGLAELFIKAHNLITKIGKVKFVYVPRIQNKSADKLVNDILDGKTQEKQE